MDFQSELDVRVFETERIISSYMPKDKGLQKTVIDAMEYTISAGGKRIRPVLMKETYKLFGGNSNIIEPFMAAMEMIHTYSLMHDDLPALDNDDYRRGRKTAHVVYGEGLAILAGDGLLNYAFETAVKAFDMLPQADYDNASLEELKKELLKRNNIERALSILANNSGIYGMVGGQAVDVELTGTRLNEEQLDFIYNHKTGALIEASMTIGAVLAGADESTIREISDTAYNIGVAFQIQDDILDETATFEELGKPIHSDEESGKVTYVTLYGMDKAKQEVLKLSKSAIDHIMSIDSNALFLADLIKYLINRTN